MTTFDVTDAPTRELLEGSEAIAEAMVAAGCRFFAGYPMTPFTEVLEHMASKLPAVGGVCMNAESELEAIGMAWGAAATGTPAATGSTGQGLSLMQESLAEMCARADPARRAQHGARRRATTSRPPAAAATATTATPCSRRWTCAEAVELTQLAFHLARQWRNPVLIFGDYYLAHTTQSVAIAPLDFGALPADRLGARRLHRRHRQRPAAVAARHRQAARRPWATTSPSTTTRARTRPQEMLAGIEPLVETGLRRRRRAWSWSRSARPATLRARRGRAACGPTARASASSGRSRCCRSRPRRSRPRPTARGPSRSTRTTRAR